MKNKRRGMSTIGLAGLLALAGGCGTHSGQPTMDKEVAREALRLEPPDATSTKPAPSTRPAGITPPTTMPAATQSSLANPLGSGASPQLSSGVTASTVLTLAGTTEPAAAAASQPTTNATGVPQTTRVAGWYQWRGPEQNGVSREKNLPEKWSPEGENLIWTSDVGGMSSPVIWNGKLYTFTRSGEVQDGGNLVPGPMTQEALTCVDIANGKVLWQHNEAMTQTEVPFHRLGWSSPCVDPSSGRVYAIGSQCTMMCLDGESGKVIWKRQMTEEFGMISTFGGRTPSPMVDEDQVFVAEVSFGWGDHAGGQDRIFALNKNTGELNWSAGTGGIPVDAPQNTPVIAVVNGVRQVVFASGDGSIVAFQARTGKHVWSYKASKRGINTSVVVDGTKLYCSHGLENFDTSTLGRVFCLDLTQIKDGAPKEIWKITGDEAAFPTCCVADKWVYVVDDKARLYQIDKETGDVAWKKPVGRIGKPSPVWADGKIYCADGNGQFSIIKPEATSAKVLSRVDLSDKFGREYAIYGSPAIVDGRVYIQTATKIYCIGKKDQKPEYGEIPALAAEAPAAAGRPAQVLVEPCDVAVHAGKQAALTVRLFDANGRELPAPSPESVKWEIGELTIPPPPKRPVMRMPDEVPPAAGAVPVAPGGATTAPAATAPATLPVVTGPVKVGNLLGEVDAKGVYHTKPGPPQGGAINATVAGVTGFSRVRVFPSLPWKIDFEKSPIGKPPLTWLGAGGKYAVVQDPDDPKNKVLQKLMNIDLYYRARTNMGTEDMSNYTVQADAKVEEKIAAGRRYVPSASIMNSRYVLIMDGMNQRLQIHVWPSALPDERNPHGSINATMPFPFEAKKWYRLKLEVMPAGAKAVARGKCWPADAPEPKDWMLTLEDPIPNFNGNPGLFSVSLVGQFKSEVYYDNILVTPNAPPPAAQAAAKELNK